ncbi:MAG: type II toxin-antitoxin system MqsA family antitoxin [Candidatus Viridilinea halotolerans]|uniref:Type II toxin-antitoxin system MqsA family antitoxin n=1 Tax=Candidatus Viridilinea halotolerans TaxID=2491704 RepID=A0A426TSQ8_9CHLR|nr:MAG: type II toxin-antitoxin system MqsA family antitoxin [Candidatus Viridilinea halotolerans]
MQCNNCGTDGAQTRFITRIYGKGEDLLVIENIPVINCPHCGESYLTAETLHRIAQIKRERKQRALMRSVAVAEF